jgi:hypothetical protein
LEKRAGHSHSLPAGLTVFMPSQFERHAGRGKSKQWRGSVRVPTGGDTTVTLGKWLGLVPGQVKRVRAPKAAKASASKGRAAPKPGSGERMPDAEWRSSFLQEEGKGFGEILRMVAVYKNGRARSQLGHLRRSALGAQLSHSRSAGLSRGTLPSGSSLEMRAGEYPQVRLNEVRWQGERRQVAFNVVRGALAAALGTLAGGGMFFVRELKSAP